MDHTRPSAQHTTASLGGRSPQSPTLHSYGDGATKPLFEPAPQSRGPTLLEPLEPRVMLAADVTATWIGGSGDWWEPGNWDIGVVPNNGGGTTYSVVIDLPAADPVVTIDRSGVTINTLTNAETLRVEDGATTVSGDVVNSGVLEATGSAATFTLAGSVVNTGDMTAQGASRLRFSGAL